MWAVKVQTSWGSGGMVKYGSVMFSLNGTLKKSGSVGRWETKQFIGMALLESKYC